MLSVIAAAVLSFTVSPYEADSTGCGESLNLERVAKVRLFGAPRYSDGRPWLIRERSTQAGPDTLIVVDEGGWSYWVAIVDSAGNQTPLTCAPSITVGVPTVEVAYPEEGPDPEVRYYDLSGRRLVGAPTSPGWYWKKRKGQRPRKILVFVRVP